MQHGNYAYYLPRVFDTIGLFYREDYDFVIEFKPEVKITFASHYSPLSLNSHFDTNLFVPLQCYSLEAI